MTSYNFYRWIGQKNIILLQLKFQNDREKKYVFLVLLWFGWVVACYLFADARLQLKFQNDRNNGDSKISLFIFSTASKKFGILCEILFNFHLSPHIMPSSADPCRINEILLSKWCTVPLSRCSLCSYCYGPLKHIMYWRMKYYLAPGL